MNFIKHLLEMEGDRPKGGVSVVDAIGDREDGKTDYIWVIAEINNMPWPFTGKVDLTLRVWFDDHLDMSSLHSDPEIRDKLRKKMHGPNLNVRLVKLSHYDSGADLENVSSNADDGTFKVPPSVYEKWVLTPTQVDIWWNLHL